MEAVSTFFDTPLSRCVKSLLVIADSKPVLALLRGDHELNEIKLKKAVGADQLRLASAQEIREYMDCAPGEIGPVNVDFRIVSDHCLQSGVGLICGANHSETHLRGLSIARDLASVEFADLRMASDGDPAHAVEGSWSPIAELRLVTFSS